MKKLTGMIIRETDKGMYFAPMKKDGTLAQPKWIPKSRCHVMEQTPKPMDTIKVEHWVHDTRFADQDIDTEE